MIACGVFTFSGLKLIRSRGAWAGACARPRMLAGSIVPACGGGLAHVCFRTGNMGMKPNQAELSLVEMEFLAAKWHRKHIVGSWNGEGWERFKGASALAIGGMKPNQAE